MKFENKLIRCVRNLEIEFVDEYTFPEVREVFDYFHNIANTIDADDCQYSVAVGMQDYIRHIIKSCASLYAEEGSYKGYHNMNIIIKCHDALERIKESADCNCSYSD